MSEVRVYIRHVRKAAQCSRGARAFFHRYDLDWSDFLHNGLPVETLEATGNALALRVCAVARQAADQHE